MIIPPPLAFYIKKTVNLNGGLGNQMFQYAFGQKLKQMTGCKIFYDKTWFDSIKENNLDFLPNGTSVREYMLHIFNLKINFASVEQVEALKQIKKAKIRGSLGKLLNIPKYKTDIIRECNPFEYDEALFRSNLKYYEGYFQNPKYLEGIEEKIKKDFTFPTVNDEYNLKIIEQIKSCSDPVFIHIRRGDYLNLNWELNLNYYKKALDYILQKVQKPTFFIFGTQSLDFIKENFKLEYPFHIIGEYNALNQQDWVDMYLMSLCKHAIIANSTFSWWGAWLKKDTNGIVIAPDPFVKGSNTILPTTWRKIKWQEN